MKVKAAVLRPVGGSNTGRLTVETVELAPPAHGEVLVRILAAGLCHSDLSVINGSRPRPLPMVLGHEAAGEIVEVGHGVDDLRVGDHVIFSFVPMCGSCGQCSRGRGALCEAGAASNAKGELLGGGVRWSDKEGRALNHHLGVSAFAEFVVASSRSVVRLDSDLPAEIAALFGCAVMTGVGAIVNTAKVAPGEAVAIFGLGGVGLAALLGARSASAHPIIVIDINDEKLALARSLGADQALNATTEDVVAAVRDLTGGGVEYAIEFVGNEHVLAQAYAVTRRGGTTVAVGLAAPDRMFSVPAVSLVAEERTIRGCYMGSAVPSRDLPRLIAMYRAGVLPVDKLLTHRLRLEDINTGFDRLANGEGVRQVITF